MLRTMPNCFIGQVLNQTSRDSSSVLTRNSGQLYYILVLVQFILARQRVERQDPNSPTLAFNELC